MFGEVFVGVVFVAEARADIVDFFVAGAKETFEGEFVADAEVELLVVEGVHVGHEGIGVGATSGVFEDGDVDFEEAVFIEEVAGGLPEFGAPFETGADVVVDCHIDVAATEAFFFVREAVAAREGTEGFSEDSERLSEDGDFAGFTFADVASCANEVAGVEEVDVFHTEVVFGVERFDLVFLEEKLDLAGLVGDDDESEFAKATDGFNAADDVDG